jgi:alkylation response protein AidB-like acyl-CoA dehydrogenase
MTPPQPSRSFRPVEPPPSILCPPDWHETPFFDAEHRQLVKKLEGFVAQEIAPMASTDETMCEENAREYVLRLANARLLGYAVRGEIRAVSLIRYHLARASALADAMFAMQGLGALPILIGGTEAQKKQWLPKIEDGAIAAFALTEEGAGSDPAAMSLKASRVDDFWRLDGEKTFISNAGIADVFVVFARTAPGERDAHSAFVVKGHSRRIKARPIEVISPHPIGAVQFDCADSRDLLGEQGQGLRLAMGTLDRFRPTVGAAACGMARRALDEAATRASKRVQFGKAIAEFQGVQFMLADMATELAAAELLVARAAWDVDRNAGSLKKSASIAKLFATDYAQSVIDRAVQIFGGSGVVKGQPVERLYRDVRALRIYEGTSEIQRVVIAREMTKGR